MKKVALGGFMGPLNSHERRRLPGPNSQDPLWFTHNLAIEISKKKSREISFKPKTLLYYLNNSILFYGFFLKIFGGYKKKISIRMMISLGF